MIAEDYYYHTVLNLKISKRATLFSEKEIFRNATIKLIRGE